MRLWPAPTGAHALKDAHVQLPRRTDVEGQDES